MTHAKPKGQAKKLARGLTRVCAIILFAAGLRLYLFPGSLTIPVEGAGPQHWTEEFFWQCPWCSGDRVHFGLDIIRPAGTPLLAAKGGLVVYTGWDPFLGRGGEIVLIAGSDLRFHYYAHLSEYRTQTWSFVSRGEVIGLVGNTGASDLPHLHYTIFSPGPHPHVVDWNAKRAWLQMFFLNPHLELMQRVPELRRRKSQPVDKT